MWGRGGSTNHTENVGQWVNGEKTSKPQRQKRRGEAGGDVAGFDMRQQQSGSHPPPRCGVTQTESALNARKVGCIGKRLCAEVLPIMSSVEMWRIESKGSGHVCFLNPK